MAIVFRCTQCGRLLRVGDDTAGKPAQCPECGTITTVPTPDAQPPPPADSPSGLGGPEPEQPGDVENPYQSPVQYDGGPGYPLNAMATSRVAGPATALMVTAGLGIATQALAVLAHIAQIGLQPQMHGRGGPDAIMLTAIHSGVGLLSAAVGIIVGLVILVGATKMKNLENYAFAMAAAIVAMIPCISPCCILGLPFGIWALVVLSDPMVKAAFRG
jgi:hypothetical protein